MYFKVLWGMGLIIVEFIFIYLLNIILIISNNIHNFFSTGALIVFFT